MKFPAKTHEDRCMVLENMPHQALVETIKDHVLRENGHLSTPQPNEPDHIPWLQSVVDGRFLCADGVNMKIDPSPRASAFAALLLNNALILKQRQARWDAFFSVLWKPEFHKLDVDPIHGALKHQPLVATLSVSERFDAVFRQAILQLVKDDINLTGPKKTLSPKSFPPAIKNHDAWSVPQWNARNDLIAQALCLVCALGHADLVAPLVDRSSEALKPRLPLDMLLWNNHVRNLSPKPNLTISPLFFAIQFSQPQCIQALCDAGMSPSEGVLRDLQNAKGSSTTYSAEKVWTQLVPSCSPSTLEVALELGCRSSGPDFSLIFALDDCLVPDDKFNDLSRYLPALMATGHMAFGNSERAMTPSETDTVAKHIQNACWHGHPEVIDHFKGRIPWGHLAPELTDAQREDFEEGDRVHSDCDFVFKVACSLLKKKNEATAETLTLLLNAALEDNQKGIFSLFSEHNGHNMEPVQTLIDANLSGALLAYMKNGLDVNVPMRNDGRTPLQHAIAQDMGEVVDTMRSFEARKSVYGLLDEIQNENDSKFEKPGLVP